ncbi:MAG: hypothetical protein ACREXT_15655, partial [Gammaproteobacteria bacterium]
MALLIDLFGFLSVLLRGVALALSSIVIGGVVFQHCVLTTGVANELSDWEFRGRLALIRRSSAIALVTVALFGKALDVSILISSVGVTWSTALTAPFVIAGFASCVAGAVLAITAGNKHVTPWLEASMAVVLLGSLIATTHAAGRLDSRPLLVAFSTLHQAGGAAWIGGLPYFLLVLGAAMSPGSRAAIARRYSKLCVI